MSLTPVTEGSAVRESNAWRVNYSGGERTIRIGSRWHQYLTDTTWEVVAPGGRSYSPSGLGGCQDFWCKPVGEVRDKHALSWINDYGREDGCVEFCGDSIAAGLITEPNTDSAGRAYWVAKPGESLPHDAPSGGKGEAAGATRQAGETPAPIGVSTSDRQPKQPKGTPIDGGRGSE